jgi:NADH:ubiquinone oxidoreductase subunit 6 (subunit J)
MKQHSRRIRHTPEWTTEYIKSREWMVRSLLFMSATLLVAVVARVFFRPFFVPAMVLGGILFVAVLYSAGRFYWHQQKAARIARQERRHPIENWALRLYLDWPVPISLVAVIVLFALIVAVAEMLARAGVRLR